MAMRHHWPIARTALAAITPLVLVLLVHSSALDLSLATAAWFLIGILYTQLFEYWAHRVPMHRGLPLLTNVRRNHLEHHRVFHGARFQSRDVADLAHIAGRFWVFPLLFLGHYGVLAFVLEPGLLIAFLSGTVIHYLAFELTHWLTHIEDNPIDRAIARVGFLADLRAYQIEHHRIHHEFPELAFNFNPPYLGDRIAGHMPTMTETWTPAPEPILALVPHPAAAATASLAHDWRRYLVRYGAAAVTGIALVGAIVVAHGLLSQAKRYPSNPEQSA